MYQVRHISASMAAEAVPGNEGSRRGRWCRGWDYFEPISANPRQRLPRVPFLDSSWPHIHRRVLVENVSKRQILRETGIHWKTLERILSNPQPPGYCPSQPRPQPKIGPFRGRIEEILKKDRDVPRKQRHTVKRIFERLREEGYTGGYTQVKGVVKDLRGRCKEVSSQ